MKFVELLKEDTNKYTIYCDMDGCLTDFGKACKNVGIDVKTLDGNEEAWDKIKDAGEPFWSEMPWMPNDKGGKALWDYIKKYNPTILSAPSRDPASKTGKRKWIDRELGKDVKAIFTPKKKKQEYANAHSILIDDHPGNIQRWVEAGGIGIHHPFDIKQTIEKLKELGL